MLTAQKIQIWGATVNMEGKNSFISEANSHPAGTDWLPNLQVAFEYMCIPSSLFFLNFFNPESCANTCSRNVTFHTHFLDPSFFSVCNTGIRSVCSPFVLLQQLQWKGVMQCILSGNSFPGIPSCIHATRSIIPYWPFYTDMKALQS